MKVGDIQSVKQADNMEHLESAIFRIKDTKGCFLEKAVLNPKSWDYIGVGAV